MKIIALHGFLGSPYDWMILFQNNSFLLDLTAVNLFKDDRIEDFHSWAYSFNSQIKNHRLNTKDLNDKRMLMGYSMGGRLALHALIAEPDLWHAAVIISSHLGLDNPKEKKERYKHDEQWAHRFLNDEWEQLLRDWNAQSVFCEDALHFDRNEADYCRSTLAFSLRKWSLSHQDNLLQAISHLNMPIFWIAGENDLKYANQAKQLANNPVPVFKNPLSRIWVVPETGHRVPWQQPTLFLSMLTKFLSEI